MGWKIGISLTRLIRQVKVQEAVEAWKVVRRIKSLPMRLYAIHQVQRLESYRSGVEFAIAPQSLDPNNVFRINHDDQEKNLKRLREMNQVLEPENEGLREEVKRWVQQATTSQR